MFTSLSSRDRLLLFLLAVFVSLLYFQGTLYFTKGGLVFPTDDTYIYFQYARQFASGHPFQYNDGDPPTTGATSLLYLLVLTFFDLIGPKGEGLIYSAFFFGVFLLALSALVSYRVGERLESRAFGLAFSLLFLLNGGITWGYLCGMEVALVSTLLLLTCYSCTVDLAEKRCLRTTIACSLLVLARPEGLIIGSSIALLMFINRVFLKRDMGRRWAFLLPLPLLVSIGYLVLNYWLTGQISPTSGSSKGLWVKPTSLASILDNGSFFLEGSVRGLFGGYFPHSAEVGYAGSGASRYFAPLSLLFFVFGSFPFVLRELGQRRIGAQTVFLACFGLGVLTVAFSSSSGFQNHRYLIPFYPIFLLFLVQGLFFFSDSLGQLGERHNLKLGLLIFFLFFSLVGQTRLFLSYTFTGGFLRRTVVEVAQWVDRNTDPDAAIGLVDAGATKYYGRRRVLDLLGLTTPDLFGAYKTGGGALYEYLAHLEPNKRPDYFVLQSVFMEQNPWITFIYPVLGEQIYETPSTYGPTMVVYRADYKSIEGSDCPSSQSLGAVKGLTLVGSLDVGFLTDERRYRYQVKQDYPNYEISVFTHEGRSGDKEFVDAGRVVMGAESFTVPTVPGKELKIVMRTTGRCRAYRTSPFLSGYLEVVTGSPNRLRVWVDDGYLGEEGIEVAQDEAWSEVIVTIPPERVVSDHTRVEIRGSYTSFHCWFFQ